MMKPYFRSGTVGTVVEPESPAMVVGPTTEVVTEEEEWPQASPEVVTAEAWAGNRDATLREKLSHLTPDQQEELESNLSRFPEVFGDSPGLTGWAAHDIDVGENKPIKLPPIGSTHIHYEEQHYHSYNSSSSVSQGRHFTC
ncbi:hypothetical protein Pmani_019480 [Petrolisthes manimaculis]|uniref:Uncharacterized protein n=1 Tax=Petrolisthes manimaculis TaxID=1843537 RepID=A0AAE1PJH8_9EUCA|nr:hypothetical protein Pmani_019480 [Petrolisthes manimaculis]